jgi:hypothetical protein
MVCPLMAPCCRVRSCPLPRTIRGTGKFAARAVGVTSSCCVVLLVHKRPWTLNLSLAPPYGIGFSWESGLGGPGPGRGTRRTGEEKQPESEQQAAMHGVTEREDRLIAVRYGGAERFNKNWKRRPLMYWPLARYRAWRDKNETKRQPAGESCTALARGSKASKAGLATVEAQNRRAPPGPYYLCSPCKVHEYEY